MPLESHPQPCIQPRLGFAVYESAGFEPVMRKNSKFSPVIPPEAIACSRWSRLGSVLSTLRAGFSAEKTAEVTRSRKKTSILTIIIHKENFSWKRINYFSA